MRKRGEGRSSRERRRRREARCRGRAIKAGGGGGGMLGDRGGGRRCEDSSSPGGCEVFFSFGSRAAERRSGRPLVVKQQEPGQTNSSDQVDQQLPASESFINRYKSNAH